MSRILILDFGTQFTQLIARRVREAHVYSEVHLPARGIDFIRDFDPKGIILSGGPSSVFDTDAPSVDSRLLDLGIPVLGICYGMQLLAQLAGGEVEPSNEREYGRAEIEVRASSPLFAGFAPGTKLTVWASHSDRIPRAPPGFRVTASSANAPVAAFVHESKPLYGLLFHPEVAHTPRGGEIIDNFLFEVCQCTPDWTPGHFIAHEVERIHTLVGEQRAICALSGASTRRLRRCSSTARLRTGSPACSWTTGCSAAVSGSRLSGRFARSWALISGRSMRARGSCQPWMV